MDGNLSAFGELVEGERGSNGARLSPWISAEGMTCLDSVGEAHIESSFSCEELAPALEFDVVIRSDSPRSGRVESCSVCCMESDRVRVASSFIGSTSAGCSLSETISLTSRPTPESIELLETLSFDFIALSSWDVSCSAGNSPDGGGSSCCSAISVLQFVLLERCSLRICSGGLIRTLSPGSTGKSCGEDDAEV